MDARGRTAAGLGALVVAAALLGAGAMWLVTGRGDDRTSPTTGAASTTAGTPPSAQQPLEAARQRASSVYASMPEPAATTQDATRTYLAGDGAPLVQLLHAEAVAQLAVGRDPAGCTARATRLNSDLPRLRLLELLDALPDAALRDGLAVEGAALATALTQECPSRDPAASDTGASAGASGTQAPDREPAAIDLPTAVGLVDLRLEALGVPR